MGTVIPHCQTSKLGEPSVPQRCARLAAVHSTGLAARLGEGRTTNPQTWMRSPESLARPTALAKEADERRRAITAPGQKGAPRVL